MRDAIVGAVIGFVLRSALDAYLEWHATRKPTHRLRANYFDARAPFAIERVGSDTKPERSQESIERNAARLGKISARRYADTSESS